MELMLNSSQKQRFVEELRHRLEEGVNLPVLPEVAQELLLVRNRATADVADLVSIVSKDPVISGEIIRYARMSIFGYGDRIKTLEDAIQLVLGYEKTLHLGIGLSAGRGLPVEMDGPLGCRAFWHRSLASATLAQALAKALPASGRPSVGVSYLAGLMHDIGYLLFGSLYPEEFSELNKMVVKYSQIEQRDLEFHCIGISHDMMGAYLMRAWNMPEEITVAVAEHHFPDYAGQYAIYPTLVYLSHQLLCKDQIMETKDVFWAKFERVGLEEAAAQSALAGLKEIVPHLELMVDKLAK